MAVGEPEPKETNLHEIPPFLELLEDIPFRTNRSNSLPPSFSSSSGIDTPTDTTVMSDSTNHLHSPISQKAESMETPPYAGNTYAIRELKSGRLVTLINGNLRLENCTGEQGGWHWHCEEKQGWLGFRSPVSGTYMGHDTEGNFWANYGHHLGHEYFCARRHPNGGYVLLMRQEDELRKMTVDDSSCKLVMTTGEGTLWDFEKVNDGGRPGS